jgi:hypothetical protein
VSNLFELIAEAKSLINQPVKHEHDWVMEGGRSCPTGNDRCSQPVYRCRICGDYDYGEPGGPGHAECLEVCGDSMNGWKPDWLESQYELEQCSSEYTLLS